MCVSPAQQPMLRLCARLETLGVDLASCRALEFFAREGDWHAMTYAPKISQLDAWEIDPKFEMGLRRNLPQARIRIGNSFDLARCGEFAGQFDLVVYDNPQMFFGEGDRYCEHFEAIETLRRLMKPQAVTVLNVNMAPFNYCNAVNWQLRRNKFYDISDASNLEEGFALSFYCEYFRKQGMVTRGALLEPRYNSPIRYYAAVLEKITGSLPPPGRAPRAVA
jgi:hypothetical protein